MLPKAHGLQSWGVSLSLEHLFIDSSGMCCPTTMECSSGVLCSHGVLRRHWDILTIDSSGMCCYPTTMECSSGVLCSHGMLCSHWDMYLLTLLVCVVHRHRSVVVVCCVVMVCCEVTGTFIY